MFSLRKWLYKPKRSDPSLLAQFYYADEELNLIAQELDSFDGRKDPERCTALVNQLRQCQDSVLSVIQKIMEEVVPPSQRSNLDFRVKFPDEILQENLAGQLWFGAECLAAGSSIMNREIESASMRPLAKSVTRTLDTLRSTLRDQCFKNPNVYNERIKELLLQFDRLFSDFELSYVSAMVPVKSMREHDVLQEVTVLFCESVDRAMKLDLLTQEMVDDYDPALMFTIPRLAIICGLVVYPEGPLNPDRQSQDMPEMFRHFQTLLARIRELLCTLLPEELFELEKALCSAEEPGAYKHLKTTDPKTTTVAGIMGTQFVNDRSVSVIESPVTPKVEDSSEFMFDKDTQSDRVDSNNVCDDDKLNAKEKQSPNTELVGENDHEIGQAIAAPTEELNLIHFVPIEIKDEVNNSPLLDEDFGQRQDSVDSGVSEEEGNVKSKRDGSGWLAEMSAEGNAASSNPADVIVEDLPVFEAASQCVSREVQTDPLNLLVDMLNKESMKVLKMRTQSTQTELLRQVPTSAPETDNVCQSVYNEIVTEVMTETAQRTLQLSTGLSGRRTFSFNLPCNTNPAADTASQLTPDPDTPRMVIFHTPDCEVDSDNDVFSSSNEHRAKMTKRQSKNRSKASSLSDEAESQARKRSIPTRKSSKRRHQSDRPENLTSIEEQELVVSFPKDNEQQSPPALKCDTNDSDQVDGPDKLSNRSCDGSCDQKVVIMNNEHSADSEDVRMSSNKLRHPALGKTDSLPADNENEETQVLVLDLEQDNEAQQADAKTSNEKHLSSNVQEDELNETVGKEGEICSDQCRNGAVKVQEPQCRNGAVKVQEPKVRGNHPQLESDDSSSTETETPPETETETDREGPAAHKIFNGYDGSDTSSYTSSECNDDEEIALAVQAAELATRQETRQRFRSSSDLIHRLFVCISGVADQLQTNYASDLRNILKAVFEVYSSEPLERIDSCEELAESYAASASSSSESDTECHLEIKQQGGAEGGTDADWGVPGSQGQDDDPNLEYVQAPVWVPDDEAQHCTACHVPFTFVRRRHHCRNCGKIYCSRCSANSVPLPHFGHKMSVRVCNHCFIYQVNPFVTDP